MCFLKILAWPIRLGAFIKATWNKQSCHQCARSKTQCSSYVYSIPFLSMSTIYSYKIFTACMSTNTKYLQRLCLQNFASTTSIYWKKKRKCAWLGLSPHPLIHTYNPFSNPNIQNHSQNSPTQSPVTIRQSPLSCLSAQGGVSGVPVKLNMRKGEFATQ